METPNRFNQRARSLLMNKISVIMPVYNGEKYLHDAIQSILDQTFTDFELLVINDGSKDLSLEIIQKFLDPRIQLINLEKNIGLIAVLNLAFARAKGEIVIRMDQDDLAMSDRFQKQVDYLENHPSIGVVGTFCDKIGAQSGLMKFPIDHDHIKIHALFDNPIAHPTIAVRRRLLPETPYDAKYVHTEDYALWTRLLDSGVRFHILPEALLKYRHHSEQTTFAQRPNQLSTADLIRSHWLLKLEIALSFEEMLVHRMVAHSSYGGTAYNPLMVQAHLERLHVANQSHKVFEPKLFKKELSSRLSYAFSCAEKLSAQQIKSLLRSPLFNASFILKKSFFRSLRKAI
jgi:glycosyltransferase involved in cell wall biosynthesis